MLVVLYVSENCKLPGARVSITFPVVTGVIYVSGGLSYLCKGLSENQGRVAGGERQISDKQTAVFCR